MSESFICIEKPGVLDQKEPELCEIQNPMDLLYLKNKTQLGESNLRHGV